MDLFETEENAEFDPKIRIGTSGYSFQDWQGVFYPSAVPSNKMLDYYVRHFNTVEINSTYYRIPSPSSISSMVKRVPGNFDFMVKVPASFTHHREHVVRDRDLFLASIEPMQKVNKLSGLLAQFPYGFKFDPKNLEYLSTMQSIVSPTPLFVEFRHESWLNRAMHTKLKSELIGYVSVDEPLLPGLIPPHVFATSRIGYIRLHGRNAEHWWNGGALRYDYEYSNSELEEWAEKTTRLSQSVDTTYVFFNNCHQGHAVLNARDFRRILLSLKKKNY